MAKTQVHTIDLPLADFQISIRRLKERVLNEFSRTLNTNPLKEKSLETKLQFMSQLCAWSVAIEALVAIMGWWNAWEQHVLSTGSSVNFLLWAISFSLSRFKSQKALTASTAFSVMIVVDSVLNLVSNCFDLDFGALLQPWIAVADVPFNYPGPIGTEMSVAFLSLGLTVLCLRSPKLENLAKTISLGVMLFNTLILATFATGAHSICTFAGCVKPSLSQSLILMLAHIRLLLPAPPVVSQNGSCRKI